MCDAKINHQELDNINYVEKTRQDLVLFESENTCLNTVLPIRLYYNG